MGWGLKLAMLCAALALACAGALAGALPAAADDPDGTWISWTGTDVGAQFTVTLRCATADACVVETTSTALPGTLSWAATTTGDGTFTGSFPQSGDLCATTSLATTGGTFRLVAGAASATMTVDVDNRDVDCGGTSVEYDDSDATGAFVGGSPCVITGIPCPTPTATPTPTPSPFDSATATSAPVAAAATPVEAPLDTGLVTGTGTHLASGPAAPSVLWQLPTLAQAPVDPAQLALAALVTIVLVLLVSFPSALLNSAAEAAPERFASVFRRRRTDAAPGDPPTTPDDSPPPLDAPSSPVDDPASRPDDPTSAGDLSPSPQDRAPASDRIFGRAWWFAATGVLVAGFISAFVDPQFGFNAGSVRMVLGILVGFALDVVLGWSVVVLAARMLAPRAPTKYRFAPVSLVVVALAVLFTRLTGFEPGIVFGLVAGVAVGLVAAKAAQGRIALALAGYALLIGVAGWLLYSLFGPALAADHSIWASFAIDTLSTVAMAGVAATPIILLPLRGLAGGDVFAWNRWVWAVVYIAGMLVFFFVLMPMPYSWADVSLSLTAWIAIYVAYAVVAVAAWLWIVRPWRRDDDVAAERAAPPLAPVSSRYVPDEPIRNRPWETSRLARNVSARQERGSPEPEPEPEPVLVAEPGPAEDAPGATGDPPTTLDA